MRGHRRPRLYRATTIPQQYPGTSSCVKYPGVRGQAPPSDDHRQFLEVVKLELEGLGIQDINNVQAMMLFNIGDAKMTIGELSVRGCYLGCNVSYNVKKMVESEYLAHERSVHDRRSIHVRLTEKGSNCETA